MGGLSLLLLLLLPLAVPQTTAQIYSVLHNFRGQSVDGDGPQGGLVEAGGTLYGTTPRGGTNNYGTVFKLGLDGTGYEVLKHFAFRDGGPVDDPLIVSGETLYGTSANVVFKLNTDGSDFQVLKYLTSEDPNGPLVLSGTNLYGTAYRGGDSNLGTVFQINTDGTDYTVLKSFTGSDGANPLAGLTLADGVLYGTTYAGGISNAGVIFKMNTDGSGFTVIKDFLISDGAGPRTCLLLDGTQLYGTTSWGGEGVVTLGGTVFKISTAGTGFTVLRDFSQRGTNYAERPYSCLVLSGSTLYGTTYNGGLINPERGSLFRLDTNGTGYAVFRYFNGDGYGANPRGNLVLVDGALYGTTEFGGGYDKGVVFILSLAPPAVTPPSQTAETGGMARLAVEAPHFWSVQYQWILTGNPPVGGPTTSSWLRLTNLQPSQAGVYRAVITQAGGALTSAPAILSVIPSVDRRVVPAIQVTGEPGKLMNVECANTLNPAPVWNMLGSFVLAGTSQYCFDVDLPLPAQRFYRALQAGAPAVNAVVQLYPVPALALTGSIGRSVAVDYINRLGPTDGWVTLDTVTLTNTSQLYFDTSARGQPERLYRLVPLPE